MHASPALDPTSHVPEVTMENAASESSRERASNGPADDTFVHVKMSYLHPSTKHAVKSPRAGDISTGRIRAEPSYVPLSSYVFNEKPRRDILHAAVVYYLDGLRQGTGSTKSRGEVNYSGRKLLPQKGTGQARRGSRGSPLLRGGGVAHGPKPRDFSSKLNRRVREMALRSALSLRWRTGDLHVVKNLYWQKPPHNTNPLFKLLKAKQWDDALFLTAPRAPERAQSYGRTAKPSSSDPTYPERLEMQHDNQVSAFAIACANIPRTELIKLNDLTNEAHEKARKPEDRKKPGELHAYEVLARKKLICDLGAIEWLEEKMGGALFHEGVLQATEVGDLVDGEGLATAMSGLDVVEEEKAMESITPREAELRAAEDEAIEKETSRVLQGVSANQGQQSKEA